MEKYLGDTNISGVLSVMKNVCLGMDSTDSSYILTVSGESLFLNKVQFNDEIDCVKVIADDSEVQNQIIENLTVNSSSTFNDSIDVNGAVTCASLSVGSIGTYGTTTLKDVEISDTLIVDNTSTFKNNVDVSGTLSCTILDCSFLEVSDVVTASEITKILEVESTATFDGKVNALDDIDVIGNVDVCGNVVVHSSMALNTDVDSNYVLKVDGDINFNNNAVFKQKRLKSQLM